MSRSADFDSTLNSRSRLLAAGKMLFARTGYEQTSTASIVREAGTSESQLVRYFNGKAGLLQAIFNESWAPLNIHIRALVAQAPSAREGLLGILQALIRSFSADQEIAFLFMFEGRRLRTRGEQVQLSEGFLEFLVIVRELIARGQQDGTLNPELSGAVITSALFGAAEGMVRDRLLAERMGHPAPFTDEEITRVFEVLVRAL
jgi:AcrR family transcriptional regulator